MIDRCQVLVAWMVFRMLGSAAIVLMTSFGSPLCLHSSEPLQPAPPPFYPDKMELLVWRDEEGTTHPVQDAEAWQRRRQHILANMQLVMGLLPERGRVVPLDVQVLQTEKLPKLTRQKILYTAGVGDRVPAYLLIPQGLRGRAPGMLCLHGTSGPRGRTAGLGADYPRYTLELAERGYVTIAPDYPLLGENQTDPAALGYVSGTMKGIWDHIRAVDLLAIAPRGRRRADWVHRGFAGRPQRPVCGRDGHAAEGRRHEFRIRFLRRLHGRQPVRLVPDALYAAGSHPCMARTPRNCRSIFPKCWPRLPHGTCTFTLRRATATFVWTA